MNEDLKPGHWLTPTELEVFRANCINFGLDPDDAEYGSPTLLAAAFFEFGLEQAKGKPRE